MKCIKVALIFAAVWAVLGSDRLAVSQAGNEFPTLWSSVQSGESKSYHVLYQLEMDQSNDLLMLEEWADYDERLYRLDLITAGKSRTSYLFNGQSHEVFRYKPYTCDRLTADSKDFDELSKLFIGYPWSREAANASEASFKEPIMALGLGPLWLRAGEDFESVRPVKQSGTGSGMEFKKFDVVLKRNLIEDQLPYVLRFTVAQGAQHFVDFVDWLLKGNEQQGWKVAARLKVIQLDYEAPDARSFQIPLGYGCQRRLELDHELQIDIGLVLLHEGVPNQIALDVTFSQPDDELLHSWTSHRYAMRLLRFSRGRPDNAATSESVYVSLVQARSLLDGGKLARTKRVWWAPDSSAGLASVYEIDQDTGDCLMTHRDVRDQIVLGYLDLTTTGQIKPMVLSVDQISFLFSDNNGYHLIESGADELWDQRQYEKRVNNFKLTTDGAVEFEGPVSIVKRISSYARVKKALGGLAGKRKPSLLRDYRSTLTIFFYNESRDRLLYKIVVELLGNHEVSYAYAHEQMDISACAEGAISGETGAVVPTQSGGKQTITVKYDLEDQRLAQKLKQRQDTLLSALFVSLFDQPTTFLSPLQLTEARLSFDLFAMRLQLTILDLPLSELFQLELGHKLAATDNSSYASRMALLETTSSSAELCAHRCEHYNCLRFSYEPGRKVCQIELAAGGVNLVECHSCQLYSFLDRRSKAERRRQLDGGAPARPYLSAAALVEYFAQLVEELEAGASAHGTSGARNPLQLSVNLGPLTNPRVSIRPEMVELRPSSVRHELESMNEYERQLNEANSANSSKTQPADVVRQLAGRKLKLEFVRLMEDARMPGQRFDGLATYEQCEQYCEMEDCRSFSYCEHDFACELSQMHDQKYIEKRAQRVEPRLHCHIYTLDYLTKFEPYGRALTPIQVRRSSEATTARACANICMDTQDFACQGFFHCLLPANTNKQLTSDAHVCHLIDKHVTLLGAEQRERVFGSPPLGLHEAQAAVREICNFWSRSYVAQFDKYFGRSIEPAPEDSSKLGRSLVIKTADDTDAEHCARRCIELKCLAFDVCPAQRAKQACTLVFEGLRSSQLKGSQRCTTFVLSDKSHFNSKKITLLQEDGSRGLLKPDREARLSESTSAKAQTVLDEQLERVLEAEQEMSILRRLYEHESLVLVRQFANSGHWLARLFSFALGIGSGCLLMALWNEAYARGWIDRTRQQLSTVHGQRFA